MIYIQLLVTILQVLQLMIILWVCVDMWRGIGELGCLLEEMKEEEKQWRK